MTKPKQHQDRDTPFVQCSLTLELAHERWCRRRGGNNGVSAYVRKLIDADMRGVCGAPQRRAGPPVEALNLLLDIVLTLAILSTDINHRKT